MTKEYAAVAAWLAREGARLAAERSLWRCWELWELFYAAHPETILDKWLTFPRALTAAGLDRAWQGAPVRTKHGLRCLWIVGPQAKRLARCPAREVSRTYNEERGLI
jgi:hypothetical protein